LLLVIHGCDLLLAIVRHSRLDHLLGFLGHPAPGEKLAGGWMPEEAKQMIQAAVPDNSEQQVAAVNNQ